MTMMTIRMMVAVLSPSSPPTLAPTSEGRRELGGCVSGREVEME